jgi:iron complex transport system ATP-binding protein
VKDLCFGYASTPILKNINLNASPGEITAIIGPNGAGKSTLLKCIAGLLKPKSGRILINGRDVKEFKREEIVKIVSYIPQDHSIRAVLTVFEVVLLGRIHSLSWKVDDKDLEITLKTLKDLGIEKFASRYIDELSGGQRQMVFIAQALVREPKVLLLDEPVSNLDIKHQLEILDLIRKITNENNITTLIILHDLNLAARYADKLVVLRKGEIYANGKPEHVLTKEMIRDVYGVYAKVDNDDGVPQIIPLRSIKKREGLC